MRRRWKILIVVIPLCITVLGLLIWWASPSFTAPSIDDSWLIVCNTESCDIVAANWIKETYGGEVIDITQSQDFNRTSQSLLFIGGSRELAIQLPWVETFPPLSVPKPYTQPEAYWQAESWETAYIYTPYNNYFPNDEDGVLQHSYGLITKGYDYVKRRWIIICIGWCGHTTAYGAKLLCTKWDTIIGENRYVVYEMLEKGGVDPDLWEMRDFNGLVVEYGK